MRISVIANEINKQVENYLSLYPEEQERLAPLIHQLNENKTDIFFEKITPGTHHCKCNYNKRIQS